MSSGVDEEKMVFLLKLLKDEWDQSKVDEDCVQGNPDFLRRCVSTFEIRSDQKNDEIEMDEFNESKIKHASKKLIPLVNGCQINLVEVSQSKQFEQRELECDKSTQAISPRSRGNTIPSQQEDSPFDNMRSDEIQIERRKEDVDNVLELLDQQPQSNSKPFPQSRQDCDTKERRGYKKKVNVMGLDHLEKDEKVDSQLLSFQTLSKTEQNADKVDFPEPSAFLDHLKIEKVEKPEKVEKIENPDQSISSLHKSKDVEFTMECKGDKSSQVSIESSATGPMRLSRNQVEVMGLKARISELELIIDEMQKTTPRGQQPSLWRSERSSPSDLSNSTSPRLKDGKTKMIRR
ncbi:hypothetical protein EIN_268720, partial [Entamoeba invadens IP1]